MSGNAAPISSAKFAAALPELPLSSLHAKGAEIRNSIAHLTISNEELQNFADEGDPDCKEALEENREVVQRMKERLDLLQKEVENRGYKWEEHAEMVKGEDNVEISEGEQVEQATADRVQGGSLDDAELARRLAEQMQDDDDDGIHL